jgi:signal recognition particle receptor subunit beta
MPTATEIFEALLTPSMPLLVVGLLVIIGAPIILHLILTSGNVYTSAPSVLLLGPSNAGKTALLTLFERGESPAATHTSQVPQTVELNASTDSDSKASFRNHDDTTGTHTKFLLVDTPGHGKLRNLATARLEAADKLRAIVFVVDAAAISEHDALAHTASYLYDVLLHLQRRASDKRKPKAPVPVLVAANKMDLFTALPAAMVKSHLEAEFTRIRASKSKGLLDSGVGMDDIGSEEQDAWLGEFGSEKFSFAQLQEFEIDVEVMPGSAVGDSPGADKWWWWIAQRV